MAATPSSPESSIIERLNSSVVTPAAKFDTISDDPLESVFAKKRPSQRKAPYESIPPRLAKKYTIGTMPPMMRPAIVPSAAPAMPH